MFGKVDKHSGIPSYVQIMNLIKKEVMVGALNAGDKLPSVRVMQDDFGVNVNTVIKALEKLQIEGVLEAQHGVGYFIKAVEQIDPEIIDMLQDVIKKLKKRGSDLHTILLLIEEVWKDV